MNTVKIAKIPECDKASKDFSASVDGKILPVREVRVSSQPFNTWWPGHQRGTEQTETASFASFDFSGKVKVEIKVLSKKIEKLEIRPKEYGIIPEVNNNVISFTLDKPLNFTVEVNGFHNVFHMFANGLPEYDVDFNSPDTIYYGPGVHTAGLIILRDNQTLYVDDGAVVYASVYADRAKNARVLGHGVIDSSIYKRMGADARIGKSGGEIAEAHKREMLPNKHPIGNLTADKCDNLIIDGVIFRDPPSWSFNIYDCENVKINNIKMVGLWRYNADGIDIYLGKNFEITNSFIRSFDDSIVARGACGAADRDIFENLVSDNCVLWCEWGRAMEIWTARLTSHISGVVFKNCHIIRTAHIAMDLQVYNGGPTYMDNIVFDNISVDTDTPTDRPVYQKSDDMVYCGANDAEYQPTLFFTGNTYKLEAPINDSGLPCDINFTNVTVRNIRVYGTKMLGSAIHTSDKYMKCSDVAFSDISFNGKKLTDKKSIELYIGSEAQNITLDGKLISEK